MNPIYSLRRRTPLGWLQLNHEKGRLLVAIAGVAFADILMLMQLGFQGALFESGVQIHKTLKADIVITSTEIINLNNSNHFSRRRLYQSLDIPGVQSVDAIYLEMTRWKHPITLEQGTVLMMGIDPSHPVLTRPDVNAQLDRIKLPDRFLFDQDARGDFDQVIAQIRQGKQTISEIDRRRIYLDGLISVGSSFAADGTLITSDQTFLRLNPDRPASQISLGLLTLKSGVDAVQTAEALRKYLPNDVRVFTIDQFIEFEYHYWATNTAIGFIFTLGVAMGFIVGIIIVYQVLATDVNSHIGEYATFRAMGYRQFFLLSIVFEEAILLAVLGFVPSLGIAMGLYHLTRGATSLPIAMTLGRAAGVLIATIAMCLISGAIATQRLQAADPADIF